jgi:hypothetical protein
VILFLIDEKKIKKNKKKFNQPFFSVVFKNKKIKKIKKH